VISGRDPRHDNELYVNQLILGVTGGAGAPEADAWMPIVHVGNAGMCRQDSIEVDELSHPLHVPCRRLLADTEGAGTFRGAPSIEVEFGPADDNSMRVLYVADGTINPAAGARGGLPGAPIKVFKRGGNGEVTAQAAYGDVELMPGETIISISSGGGGYGPPGEREAGRVKHDLDEGWITRERAETVYGLALDDAGEIDLAATEARRAGASE
jgi:N-methylhydantoinase B